MIPEFGRGKARLAFGMRWHRQKSVFIRHQGDILIESAGGILMEFRQ